MDTPSDTLPDSLPDEREPLIERLQRSPRFQESYELLSELGEGAFGRVYEGRQRTTGQTVAIKILHADDGEDASAGRKKVARFRREAHICAQVHHPNIVRLMDAGQAETGVFYTVFEYVPGHDLAQVLAHEGALGLHETTHLMVQVLDALSCAHRLGIVHRDLKPHNIMITTTGARRNALVLDFGIGALTAHGLPWAPNPLTGVSEIVGTPRYAAPEQLRGEPLTPRADLYAWGLVFLECLTGKPVYGESSISGVISRQLGPEPVPIPAMLDGHLLGRILQRVTTKEVMDRDVSAEGILYELTRREIVLLGQPVCPDEAQPAPGARDGTLDLQETSSHGLRVDEDQLARTRADAGAPFLAGERRPITAVSCTFSIMGQTSADQDVSQDVDLELYDALLRAQHDLCVEVAGRHGGHVAGGVGDRIMLYFGYPRTQEDDAHRAARATLEIAEEVRRWSERLESERNIRLGVQLGMHTGLVVSGGAPAIRAPGQERSFAGAAAGAAASGQQDTGAVTVPGAWRRDVVGITPSLAARLDGLARPGQILVSQASQVLLHDAFVFERVGRRFLHGLGRFIEVHELRGADA